MNNLVVIGGIDPTGHAGILQDIKVANYFSTKCNAVISANTIQSDHKFVKLNPIDNDIFEQQFNCIMDSCNPCVVKSGVLASIGQIKILASYLKKHPKVKYICDPIIGATSGGTFMYAEVIHELKKELLPLCYLITPNYIEAQSFLATEEILTNMQEITYALSSQLNIDNILLKGGHAKSVCNKTRDYLNLNNQLGIFYQSKETYLGNIRGTGCSLATSIASLITQGEELAEAVCIAKYHLTYQIALATKGKSAAEISYLTYYHDKKNVIDTEHYLPNVYNEIII